MATFESDPLDLHWKGSSGVSDKTTDVPLTSDQPLRIASITKTYVATTILRLMELGKLKLDDSIDHHLPEHQLQILRDGGYQPTEISIRHLLTQTSGIRDYAMTENFAKAVHSDTQKRWTREEQLQFSINEGAPIGKAGEYYHYSDSGYILLGEIIEQRSGMGLAAALRSLLKFDDLGLKVTWLETLEPSPAAVPARTHQYWNGKDINSWDPSFDLYGGGGLVANMPDVAGFYSALLGNKIFENPRTLAVMLTSLIPDYGGPFTQPGSGSQYSMGIVVKEYRGFTMFEHGGFWGIYGFYIPALKLSVGMAITEQTAFGKMADLREALLDVLIDTKEIKQ
ncbi:MAG: beta-lactamase family protein [Emcibacter sp.]|nr:beta-lactamase family protein [Emcibacter sp.]